MTTASVAGRAAATTDSVETRYSWVVAVTALGILAVSFGAPTITVVALKPIAADLGGVRSAPALCYALAWLGSAAGGIAMGQIAERLGVRWTVMCGALMVAAGLLLSSLGKPIDLYLGHGLFMGLLGNSGLNYAAAFAAGIAFGLANTVVIAMLVLRQSRARAAARAGLIQPDSAVLAVLQQLSASGIVFAARILEFRRLGGAKNSG